MTEHPHGRPKYRGEQLYQLTLDLRLRIFKAALFLAALLTFPALVLVLQVGDQVSLRFSLLAALCAGFVLLGSTAEWCVKQLRRSGWLLIPPTILATTILVLGQARQNATFFVITAALIGTPAVVDLVPAMTAAGILALGYWLSIWLRHQPFLINGSAGDLAAVLTMLVAVFAASRVTGLLANTVTDLNRLLAQDHTTSAPPSGSGPAVSTGAAEPVSADRRPSPPAAEATADPATGRTPEASSPGPDHLPAFSASDHPDPGDVEALLRATTARAAAGRTDHPSGGLSSLRPTKKEEEVALLAADGLGPSDIASVLLISTSTAEKHLTSLRVKAGVKTRAALVDKLTDLLGLPSVIPVPEDQDPPPGDEAV